MKATNSSKRFHETDLNVPLGWVPPNLLAQKESSKRSSSTSTAHLGLPNNPIAAYLSGLYGVKIESGLMLDIQVGLQLAHAITSASGRSWVENSGVWPVGASVTAAMPGISRRSSKIQDAGIAVEIDLRAKRLGLQPETPLSRATDRPSSTTIELIEKYGIVATCASKCAHPPGQRWQKWPRAYHPHH